MISSGSQPTGPGGSVLRGSSGEKGKWCKTQKLTIVFYLRPSGDHFDLQHRAIRTIVLNESSLA